MGLYAGYGFVTEKGNRALRDDRFGALRGGFNGKRTYQGNTDCGGNVRYQGACQRKNRVAVCAGCTHCLLLLERGKSAGNRRKGESGAWPSSAWGRGTAGND